MSCDLCPRSCKTDRKTQRGFCGCSYTMRIARIGLHRYEEPCLAGAGGAGTVFFSGCNLRCVFCQNKVLQTGDLGQDFTPEALAECAPRIADFAEREGLHAHARSVLIRSETTEG